MSMATRFSSQSQLQLKNMEDDEEEVVKPNQQEKQEKEEDDIEQPVRCITLYKRGGGRTGNNNNNKVYGLSGKGQWRQEQRLRASRMEHHLGIHCSLEDLIQEQLSRFDGHYSRALGKHRRLKDMSQILMPTKSRFPIEMACLSWYGNWRPSAILSLVQSFSRAPKTSSSSRITGSTPLSRSERVLSDLIKQTRTEELILDEEMAEIQATCILHLPFKKASSKKTGSVASDLACVYSEFKKIDRVYNQAQKLRYRTLELVVKKLLNPSQAAEFLVAFAGIQDMVHEFAVCRDRQTKGPISVTIKSNNGMQQLIDSYLASGR
ncbi:hypothetical protein MKW94_029142 [Papaver nudicaule]|uniref:DOG1 domain-containing protein n=1 Tax=Papaver nudicaule TaxID=74823 RepID=A0AA41RQV8_PAPNU|nr:hypothetical protein [Papaver nudicaule]